MEVKEYTDEEKQRILKFYNNLNFANLSKSILQDLRNNNTESVLYKRYKKEEILKFLENPQKNEKKIRELSNFLYIVSGIPNKQFFRTSINSSFMLITSY